MGFFEEFTTNFPRGVAWPEESNETAPQMDITPSLEPPGTHIVGLGNLATIQGPHGFTACCSLPFNSYTPIFFKAIL